MKVHDMPGGRVAGGAEVGAEACEVIGDVDVDVDAQVKAVEASFERLVAALTALDGRRFVELADRFEQRLQAARLVMVARLAGSSGDGRNDRRRARAHLSGGRGRSGRSLARDARRAATLAANETMAEQAADGRLTGDGIDALAKAADESTGAVPEDLVRAAEGAEPDQTARIVEEYLEERASALQANERYAAQMAARRVRRYTVPASGADPSLSGIGIEGPDALIDRMWAEVSAIADAAYQEAGGRERSAGDHVPLAHRQFDAAVGLFDGSGGSRRAAGRPTVVVTVGLDDLGVPGGCDDFAALGATEWGATEREATKGDAAGRKAAARRPGVQIGSGPISDDLLSHYATTGDLAAAIVGLDGQPLWLGRSRRHASADQFLALVVRDRGCVRCGTSFQRCQAHHLVPWHAPARGRTDLDQMALLCGACHRWLHAGNHTLIRRRTPTGRAVWDTRPATEAETPPPRPVARE